MNLSSGSLKYTALLRLKGKWKVAICVSFVALLLGGAIVSPSSIFENYKEDISNISVLFAYIVDLVSILSTISLIVSLIVGGFLSLGHRLFYIKLIREEHVEFSILFSRASYFLKAIGLYLMITLILSAGFIVILIPFLGIILFLIYIPILLVLTCMYSLSFFIMAENPEIGILNAMEQSRIMMQGNKMSFFKLTLSFFGWYILASLSLGIGWIFLDPYVSAAQAAFYNELVEKTIPDKPSTSSMYNI